jgi:hypothetical protein
MRYIKTGFLFLTLLFLTQCTDTPSDISDNTQERLAFQHDFNSDMFSDVIPYDFSVTWEKGKQGYSL